jgi:hypothetical protein
VFDPVPVVEPKSKKTAGEFLDDDFNDTGLFNATLKNKSGN